MDDRVSAKKSVDYAVQICKTCLDEYPYDTDRMMEVFNEVVIKCRDIVENLTEGLQVIVQSEGAANRAEALRNNITALQAKLTAFQANQYSNSYPAFNKKSSFHGFSAQEANFTKIRQVIEASEQLNSFDKRDLLEKVDRLEAVYEMNAAKQKKWEELKPLFVWLTGKDYEWMQSLLPLFLKIL